MAHTKSKTKHAQIACEEHDTLMARTVVFYRHEQIKDLAAGEKRMSLCAVTKNFEGAYLVDTGKHIQIDSCTLLHHVKGGKSKTPVLVINFLLAALGRTGPAALSKKHHDELWMYWSHNLNNKCGCAVNPATNKAWYDLLEDVLAGW
ncbi:hypothetical protein B0H14DRAFT_2597401 [Mycena olivaceomarginata]|nr:hypothetical protein B0H14DRAFT_2597401 [Mycena olivaceomarginata]